MLVIYMPGRLTHEKSKSAVRNQKNQFDGSRREINCAIDRLGEFTGKEICDAMFLWKLIGLLLFGINTCIFL